MEITNPEKCESTKIETFPYKGKPLPVKDVWIKWLSQAGPAEDSPDYGLRYFTVGPGGEIPVHNHFYVQTMYILTGNISVTTYDFETDEITAEVEAGPNDVIFIPSMEPHSLSNMSDQKEVTFLCCIANVYEEEP